MKAQVRCGLLTLGVLHCLRQGFYPGGVHILIPWIGDCHIVESMAVICHYYSHAQGSDQVSESQGLCVEGTQ